MNKHKPLSYVLKQVHKILLPNYKMILPLPEDLVFVVDSRDTMVKLYDLESGNGHEPHMINNMI